MTNLRGKLVATALEWENAFGNAPSITSSLYEYDAAMPDGMSMEYSTSMQEMSANKRVNISPKGK
jgi:hypothetical protein